LPSGLKTMIQEHVGQYWNKYKGLPLVEQKRQATTFVNKLTPDRTIQKGLVLFFISCITIYSIFKYRNRNRNRTDDDVDDDDIDIDEDVPTVKKSKSKSLNKKSKKKKSKNSGKHIP